MPMRFSVIDLVSRLLCLRREKPSKSFTRPARLMLSVLGGVALIGLCQFVIARAQTYAQTTPMFDTCQQDTVVVIGSDVGTGTLNSGVMSGDPRPLCDYADLGVEKTVSEGTPREGDTIVYTVVVTNDGPLDATSVQLIDNLPTGVTYDSHAASQGTYSSSLWTIGNLVEDASAILTITATVDSGTSGRIITNTAHSLIADQSDPNPNNNEDSAVIIVAGTVTGADLAVGKGVNDSTPAPGDIITYIVTVTNNGPKNATGVHLTDALPEGVTFDSYTATQGIYTSTNGLWEIGNLVDAANATLTIAATVDSGTSGETITNTAHSLAADQPDPNPDNNEASVSIIPILKKYYIYLPLILESYEPLICDPYYDDFSNSSSGWAIDNSGDVRTGYSTSEEYFIDRRMSGMRIVQSPAGFANRYSVEVDGRWDSANAGYEYGLIFGQVSFPGPTYLFGVDPVGQRYRLYRILTYDGNDVSWDCITEPCWMDFPSINAGSTPNRLTVECNEATIRLYVNDILLWQDGDLPSCGGSVGLFAQSSPYDSRAIAYFDNFQVSCPFGVGASNAVKNLVSQASAVAFDLEMIE